MESVREMAACLGLNSTGSISVLKDVFGFLRRRVPTDPVASETAEVSVRGQMRALEGRHFHLNVIRIGIDLFSDDEVDDLDYAIFKTRNIYATVGIGLGRVLHLDVNSADSAGLHIVTSVDDATDLTHSMSINNDGLDAFIPHSITASFVGISEIPGTCDKDNTGSDRDGYVSDKVRGPDRTARTFAHEAGHYFGLSHNHGSACPTATAARNNLMAQTRCSVTARGSVLLTTSQRNTIRGHCSIQDGC